MSSFFSLISLLIVIGLFAWWSVQEFSHSYSTKQTDVSTESTQADTNILTPIDDAKRVKELIETRDATVGNTIGDF